MINCEGIDYSTEEMQICSIADLCLEKNDMFLLSFFDSETDEFYPVTGKLINEELNNKEIELERIQVIETQNEGPWVEENEHRTLEEQNDQLVSGFFFNKMFYERPDLFEELENGKDIEELLFQMIDEELNDDVLFGEVWSREDKLSLRDRSLVTVVALMAQGLTDESFRYHLMSAKANGITKEEIAEIVTHAAFYCGWPKAWAVFRMAKEVWNDENE